MTRLADSPRPGAETNGAVGGVACACCGTRSPSRRYIAEGSGYCCEACLLDRCLPTEQAPAGSNQFYTRFVEALTETLDLREHETGLHSRRVACHTQLLARRFDDDPATLRQIYWGALLHDIGKIGIPDAILLKAGPLSAAEWTVMRGHVDDGWRIVAKLPEMALAAELVRCHEEHFDGGGYPRGLKGEAIPLGARLFAVIDTLDAMTSDRSYRRGLPFDEAKQEIVRLAGTQFDPQAVDAFLAEEADLREMVALKCSAVALPGGVPQA